MIAALFLGQSSTALAGRGAVSKVRKDHVGLAKARQGSNHPGAKRLAKSTSLRASVKTTPAFVASPVNRKLRRNNQAQAKHFEAYFKQRDGKVFGTNVSAKTQHALKRFNDPKNSYGKSVKAIDLRNKSFAAIDRLLLSKGFTKKVGTIFDPSAGGPALDSRGNPIRQVFYLHKDGGMIRVKPEGHPGSMRSAPHASKSVRNPANASHTDFAFEAFKVDNLGNAQPKYPKDMRVPHVPGSAAANRLMDSWAAAVHTYLSE